MNHIKISLKIEGVDDMIEFEIQQFINGEIELPTEVVRFKVIYSLKDKADNVGSASRIVELRGSPNLYPHIYFTLNHEDNNKGVPISDGENKNIDGKVANLPSLTWQVEVGVDQFSTEPSASVFNYIGGDLREYVQY